MLGSSRFACQAGNTGWVLSITVQSWRLRINPVPKPPTEKRPQTFRDDKPIDFPSYVEGDFKGLPPQYQFWGPFSNLRFEPDISTAILSTNAFGDFSKFTLVSKLLGDGEIKDIVDEARKLWQKFIHQPQTGRCLVFFLVLGKVCQLITNDYKEAIESLTCVLEAQVIKPWSDFVIEAC
jgi:hypothetical protein